MDDKTGPSTSPVSATPRVTAVLHALTEPGDGLSVRAVADRAATSRSAAHRILQSLVDEGYAVQGEQGRYLTGPKLLQLAARSFTGTTALQLADQSMATLVHDVNETAYLGSYLALERSVAFIHRLECTHPLRYVQQLGIPLPLDRGAIGKAVLAELVRDPGFEPPHDLDSRLRTELEVIRQRRWASSFEERVSGVAGVAAAVFARGRVVGGVTVTVPLVRLDEDRIADLGEKVLACADQISASMSALGLASI